jgi:hypothetical protein
MKLETVFYILAAAVFITTIIIVISIPTDYLIDPHLPLGPQIFPPPTIHGWAKLATVTIGVFATTGLWFYGALIKINEEKKSAIYCKYCGQRKKG